MCERRQSGYDINYFDILNAKANAISLSPWHSVLCRGVLIYLCTRFSLMGVAFNSREKGTDALS